MRYILFSIVLATLGVATFATEARAQSGSAPFCTVDNSGRNFSCYYYSMEECRRAADVNGGCVLNQQNQNGNRYDFSGRGDVLSEMQRWQNAYPNRQAAPTTDARAQRWLEMCRDMEQSYFNDLERLRSRLSPPMTVDEYQSRAAIFRERGEYCRALAR